VLQIMLLISVLFVLSPQKHIAMRLCWRNWQLLRWILIPTIVLHAVFTPGAWLFPHFFIPISREGLQLGLNLALHWAAIFTLAMLLAYLFPIQHWLRMLAHVPWLHRELYPYLCLFPRMNRVVRALIRRHYRYWNRLSWRHPMHKLAQLPHHILSLLLQMQTHSQRAAKQLWEHWGQSDALALSKNESGQSQAFPYSIALMLLWIGVDIGVFH